MWIGQLYGICTLSVFYENISKAPSSLAGMPQNPTDAIDIYREKTIQCLVLGDYTDPGPCTLETLFLYYIAAHFCSNDALFGAWLVFALLIRIAMRLGYHRDASHYPNLSVSCLRIYPVTMGVSQNKYVSSPPTETSRIALPSMDAC